MAGQPHVGLTVILPLYLSLQNSNQFFIFCFLCPLENDFTWDLLNKFLMYCVPDIHCGKEFEYDFQYLFFLGLTFFSVYKYLPLNLFWVVSKEVTFKYMSWVAFLRQIIYNWTVLTLKDSFNIQRVKTSIWLVLEKKSARKLSSI